MGVALKDLVKKEEINIDQLKGKILVVDGYNNLYQYLSSIRQRDGSLLTDSKGNVTSHLVGLFSRTAKLMKKGLKLAFVFDGETPDLKKEERERRKNLKKQAHKKYKEAKEKKDLDNMKKYASRTSILDKGMVEEAKKLINAMGLPVVQAPAEGEAQAAHMVCRGDAFAVVSQDYDSLLYGAPRVVQDLNISGRKKKVNAMAYKRINPKMLVLGDVLNELGIDQEQLIILSILVGTDYNVGGIKGIGPKTAIKLVKEYGKDFDGLFSETGWSKNFDFPWTDVFYTIKKMDVTNDYSLKWRDVDEEEVRKILVGGHDFSEKRVEKTLKKISRGKEQRQQKGLGDFL